MSLASKATTLTDLPPELLELVCQQLDAVDLIALARTCKSLRALILDQDSLWRSLASTAYAAESCTPYRSFFQLYSKLYQLRWLEKGIWMGDSPQFGSLLMSRYNPANGSICLYRLLSVVSPPTRARMHFTENPLVEVRSREMEVRTVVYAKLNSTTPYDPDKGSWKYYRSSGAILAVLRVTAQDPQSKGTRLWPPLKIPATDRSCYETRYIPGKTVPSPSLFRFERLASFPRMGLEQAQIETFSRIGPELLTPTKECPWRGIWMSDEIMGPIFILIHQPTKYTLEAIQITGKFHGSLRLC